MGWGRVCHIWLVQFHLFDFLPSAHRKGDQPRGQLQSENLPDDASLTDLQMLTQSNGRKKATTAILPESDDDDAVPPIRASRARPPRSGSVQAQKRTAARAEKATKKNTLFFDSDDEENHDENNLMDVDSKGDGVDDEQTLQSSFETRQTVGRRSTRETRSRKPAPIIVDDDSDDDAVFKGFRGQKKGR